MDPRTAATRLGIALLGVATGTGTVGAHGANDTHYDGHVGDGHMVGDWSHMGGWSGGWMVLWGLLWIVVVIAAVGVVLYWLAGGRGGRGGDDEAMAVLRQQYARGEIDHEEFEERRRRLEE